MSIVFRAVPNVSIIDGRLIIVKIVHTSKYHPQSVKGFALNINWEKAKLISSIQGTTNTKLASEHCRYSKNVETVKTCF